MSKVKAKPIISPKQADCITLVPNREILERRISMFLSGAAEGEVCLAPAAFIFSTWAEEMAVRLRQLRCLEVPRSQDALSAVMAWLRLPTRTADSPVSAFDMAAARQARAADRLLRQWLGEGQDPWLDPGFYQLRTQVRREMHGQLVFDASDWLSDLTNLLSRDEDLPFPLPAEIRLEGFIEITPLEQGLLHALERRGVRLTLPEPPTELAKPEVLAFERPEHEWQAAAGWAKSSMNTGAGSVCVVVPSATLTSHPAARRLRQAFSAEFHPREAAALRDGEIRDFHIPAAGKLSELGSVADAVLLLRLSIAGVDAPVDFARISQWLLSAHWNSAPAEATPRARLELGLRDLGRSSLTLREVLRHSRAEGLVEQIPVLHRLVEELPVPAPGTAAGDAFQAILRHWGWPGPGGAAGSSLQAVLERLQGIGFGSMVQALGMLETLCDTTACSFGGGPLSPVQILVPEVAVAGGFDAIWVCQLDDASWPPPTAPNPCLPAAAASAIPRMTPAGQQAYYRKLTAMLCAAAPEVRLSWSRDAGQGPRGRSGLLADHPHGEGPESAPVRLSRVAWQDRNMAAGQGLRMEAVADSHGLAFPAAETVGLPGGAEFFRLQAACPLLAYLRYRLAARFSPMPGPLASPTFRGELLHQAMRALYQASADEGGFPRKSDIGAAVDATLDRSWVRQRLTRTGWLAERARLERLLGDWLSFEQARQSFRVEALEREYTLHLGSAAVRVRIDRIDRLEDGRLALIDYKSSKLSGRRALKWLAPRIQEPQLPLYATLLEAAGEGEIGACAFAIVSRAQCDFDGIGDDPASALGHLSVAGSGRDAARAWEWQALKRHWLEQGEKLRDEILAGFGENRVFDEDIVRYSDLGLILRQGFAIDEPENTGGVDAS